MGAQEQVQTLAMTILQEAGQALTIEALTQELSRRVGRPLPPAQVGRLLQSKPSVFLLDGSGRWQLRQQQHVLLVEEDAPVLHVESTPATTRSFRRGCYVVFDLEATQRDALSPYTEIIQIAAERWIDGRCEEQWMAYVRPVKEVQERIHQLTHIQKEDLLTAAPIEEVLPEFLNFVGDLPLIAHNGASYDGPLIRATCERLHVALPEHFFVLDTLPLARTLLPTLEAHRVGTLFAYFGGTVKNAHLADADVAMLSTIITHLERLLCEESSGRAVYDLLRRANDPWVQLLKAPDAEISSAEVLATFGAKIVGALSSAIGAEGKVLDAASVDEIFMQAETQGRTRREAQITLAKDAAEVLQRGGYAVIEAGTGTGKSLGYLLPAALSACATGRPVAVSTYTRVLQEQLVSRELPFVQQLVPEISYAQLQGRANYLSLSRLAEEVEEAFTEEQLPAYRAWMLATLVRFAAISTHGNLEELGIIPQELDSFLHSEGAAYQVMASVRASADDQPHALVPVDFYRRARENAERASIVVVNHALLLRNSLAETEDDEALFAGSVICDEAHTLEEAATLALEKRVEERVVRRMLRAISVPGGGGLVSDCLRRLHLSRENETLQGLVRSVDTMQAALDSLNERLHAYVHHQTVVAREEAERYGVRVRIDKSSLGMPGGGALKTAATAAGEALHALRQMLARLIEEISESVARQAAGTPGEGKRRQRLLRVARSLQRDLRTCAEQYQWFWHFEQSSNYVYVIELEKRNEREEAGKSGPQARRTPTVMSAVPINVGPLLWEHLWSRLDAAICTSATLTVYSQGFDFFLSRIGLERERIAQQGTEKQLLTRELPHVFDYHNKALLLLPNNLPAPRDSELKRNFPAAVADLLRRFIPTFRGQTLGLFTARSRCDFVYEHIVDELGEKGYPLLCQGQGSLRRLIDDFRNDEATSLLGTRSLWEGVDVSGPSLSYVFLEKLPYPSLGDPVEAARMGAVENAGGNSFYEYLLPKMVMLLKQGFGRLIRSQEDRGAVILLDKRLRSSLYRREVLASLPDARLSYASDVELFQQIAEWMELPLDPADLPAPTVSDVQRVLHEQELDRVCVPTDEYETLARPRLLAIQKAIWNQETFREGQEAIIRDVLAGKDVLTLLPTGAGKSRTYQLPALIRPGLTLVISPLIALIRDQVEKLREVPGITCVASLVSGMDAASQEEVLRQAATGTLRLLYVSPERLRDPRFQAYLPQFRLVQLVVDEAHCISTWGHDFRPDFLGILNHLPRRGTGTDFAIHALTATATLDVQQEIREGLHMGSAGHELVTHTGNFVRKNLIFRVYSVSKNEERDILTLGIVHQLVNNKERGGAGIVYTATRKSATRLARLLRDHNISAQAYHAGLETAERHQIQERFMQGELDVVVATSAFGMGVDKAEIRFVLHYDHPASLEAYAQEAGRAGRDGKEAYAILLYHRQSQQTERFIANLGVLDRKVMQRYRRTLLSFAEEGSPLLRLSNGTLVCNLEEVADVACIGVTQARVLLSAFEQEGLLRRGVDCTLEATLLLTQPVAVVLASLTDATERALADLLFRALTAEPDRQVTYHAARVYEQSGIDPRLVDPLLVKLAAQEHLLYRAYRRGITLTLDERLRRDQELNAIESRSGLRYQRFEQRLQAMIAYATTRRDGNACRSADLITYLTGKDETPACGTCDLCSPTYAQLPWRSDVRLYGEQLEVDVRLVVLETVRDHNGVYARRTIERILLGQDIIRLNGEIKQLSAAARSSDHFEELKDRKISQDHLRLTLNALIEGGYLQEVEKSWRGKDETRPAYQALALTRKGRDALAGGIKLPQSQGEEKRR